MINKFCMSKQGHSAVVSILFHYVSRLLHDGICTKPAGSECCCCLHCKYSLAAATDLCTIRQGPTPAAFSFLTSCLCCCVTGSAPNRQGQTATGRRSSLTTHTQLVSKSMCPFQNNECHVFQTLPDRYAQKREEQQEKKITYAVVEARSSQNRALAIVASWHLSDT